MSTDHLQPETAKLLLRTDKERIYIMQTGCWVDYDRAQYVFSRLNSLRESSVAGPSAHLILSADAANGRSALLRRYEAMHATTALRANFQVLYTTPALYALAPIHPSLKFFKEGIFYGSDFPPGNRSQSFEQLCDERQIRVLLLDDMDYIIETKRRRYQEFLPRLLDWCDKQSIRLVLGAMPPATRTLLANEQLQGSFTKVALPRWQLDAEYSTLLRNIECQLPLQLPSGLDSVDIAEKLLHMSRRRIALLARILKDACRQAIIGYC